MPRSAQVCDGSARALMAVQVCIDLYNSAYLIAADGQFQGRYDKHRLFPVREYVPLGDFFPALKEWFPPGYAAGAQRTILPLGHFEQPPLPSPTSSF